MSQPVASTSAARITPLWQTATAGLGSAASSRSSACRRAHTSREPKPPDFFAPEALADYLAAVRNPDMIRGMCEDYRAAATIDLEHDRASRAAGDKLRCPLLVLWGSKGKIEAWYDALAVWRSYCSGPVAGQAIDSGHYLAEEAPQAMQELFTRFFTEG